ncbi:expressed unknown protein [Seminavis robusta]|uniref:Uncharacterized protein n=1 Tax=Seminavis robusta TaxID=568900 RepID=A0A9N8HRE6_9STRA|nr:expressed unknown protein [Seminavis robusta]|eukprot:Sro1388_g268460.1 n/a (225) ;mRNA; f:20752-21426
MMVSSSPPSSSSPVVTTTKGSKGVLQFQVGGAPPSLSSGAHLCDEQSSDTCFKFAGPSRVDTARPSLRPTTTPSDAPDPAEEDETHNVSTATTATMTTVSSSSSIVSIDSASTDSSCDDPSAAVQSISRNTCKLFERCHVDRKRPAFILADVTDFATQRLPRPGNGAPTSVQGKNELHRGSTLTLNREASAMAPKSSACNNVADWFSSSQPRKRRRIMKMIWHH